MKNGGKTEGVLMEIKLTGRVRKIPFKEYMIEKILQGKKCATSRSRKIAEVGDVFYIRRKRFVIIKVTLYALCQVAEFFYEQEGFDNTKEFIAYWKDLHRHKYEPQDVYYHEFKRLRSEEIC